MMRASTHIYPFIFFLMFAINAGTVMVRTLSGDVEVGLDCIAIKLLEVSGFWLKWVDLKNFWVWIVDSGVHGNSGILMFGSWWLWVGGLAESNKERE